MRKLLLLPVFFLLTLTLSAQTALARRQPAFVTDSLEKYIVREMTAWNLPGLAIAIVKDGKVVLSKGYGVTEIGGNKAVNDSTLFQIASCSKAFTATSLALIAQQKKLSLDDTVRRWLPQFGLYDGLATQQVTVRDLLCHRIGLQTFEGDFLNWGSNLSRKEIIGKMVTQKPVFGLRAQFGYCNAAFLTAGEIIPVVTGQTWDEFVKATFFDPLQMRRTSTTWSAISADKNACKGHSWWEGKEVVVPYDNIDNLGPAGSVNSCVKDLSHWILMQLDSGRYNGKQIVPFSVLQETRKPQTIIPSTPAMFPGMHFQSYGLGWFMADFYGKKIIWHNGGTSGFLSTVCIVPELNLGFVVLVNSDNNNLFNALRYQLLDAYVGNPWRNYSALFLSSQQQAEKSEQIEMDKLQALASANKNKLPLPASAFAGTYENPVYGKMMINTMDGKLAATFEHHPMMFGKLEYIGENALLCTFNSPLWGIRQFPFVIKDGKVESITVSVNENVDMMSYLFTKVK